MDLYQYHHGIDEEDKYDILYFWNLCMALFSLCVCAFWVITTSCFNLRDHDQWMEGREGIGGEGKTKKREARKE